MAMEIEWKNVREYINWPVIPTGVFRSVAHCGHCKGPIIAFRDGCAECGKTSTHCENHCQPSGKNS